MQLLFQNSSKLLLHRFFYIFVSITAAHDAFIMNIFKSDSLIKCILISFWYPCLLVKYVIILFQLVFIKIRLAAVYIFIYFIYYAFNTKTTFKNSPRIIFYLFIIIIYAYEKKQNKKRNRCIFILPLQYMNSKTLESTVDNEITINPSSL